MTNIDLTSIPAKGEPGHMSCPRNCGVDVRGHNSTDLIGESCDTAERDIAVGDRVRGRETSGQHQAEGVVVAIHYPRGLGYYQDEPNDQPAYLRNYTVDTGKTYTSGGAVLAIVECAERVVPLTEDSRCPDCGESLRSIAQGVLGHIPGEACAPADDDV